MLRRLYQTVVESPSGVQITSRNKGPVGRRALKSIGPKHDSGALASDLNLSIRIITKLILFS